jgi:hypothetical protein
MIDFLFLKEKFSHLQFPLVTRAEEAKIDSKDPIFLSRMVEVISSHVTGKRIRVISSRPLSRRSIRRIK